MVTIITRKSYPLRDIPVCDMALVNGHHLNPGNCQIVMHRTEKEFRKVLYNCPDLPEAKSTLKQLLEDPREVFADTVRFEILDHQGNHVDGGTYTVWNRPLKGEELAVANLFDSLGYNRAVREPLIKSVLTYYLVGIIRGINHLWFAFWYCCLVGIPLGLLLSAYYWIVDLFHG